MNRNRMEQPLRLLAESNTFSVIEVDPCSIVDIFYISLTLLLYCVIISYILCLLIRRQCYVIYLILSRDLNEICTRTGFMDGT